MLKKLFGRKSVESFINEETEQPFIGLKPYRIQSDKEDSYPNGEKLEKAFQDYVNDLSNSNPPVPKKEIEELQQCNHNKKVNFLKGRREFYETFPSPDTIISNFDVNLNLSYVNLILKAIRNGPYSWTVSFLEIGGSNKLLDYFADFQKDNPIVIPISDQRSVITRRLLLLFSQFSDFRFYDLVFNSNLHNNNNEIIDGNNGNNNKNDSNRKRKINKSKKSKNNVSENKSNYYSIESIAELFLSLVQPVDYYTTSYCLKILYFILIKKPEKGTFIIETIEKLEISRSISDFFKVISDFVVGENIFIEGVLYSSYFLNFIYALCSSISFDVSSRIYVGHRLFMAGYLNIIDSLKCSKQLEEYINKDELTKYNTIIGWASAFISEQNETLQTLIGTSLVTPKSIDKFYNVFLSPEEQHMRFATIHELFAKINMTLNSTSNRNIPTVSKEGKSSTGTAAYDGMVEMRLGRLFLELGWFLGNKWDRQFLPTDYILNCMKMARFMMMILPNMQLPELMRRAASLVDALDGKIILEPLKPISIEWNKRSNFFAGDDFFNAMVLQIASNGFIPLSNMSVQVAQTVSIIYESIYEILSTKKDKYFDQMKKSPLFEQLALESIFNFSEDHFLDGSEALSNPQNSDITDFPPLYQSFFSESESLFLKDDHNSIDFNLKNLPAPSDLQIEDALFNTENFPSGNHPFFLPDNADNSNYNVNLDINNNMKNFFADEKEISTDSGIPEMLNDGIGGPPPPPPPPPPGGAPGSGPINGPPKKPNPSPPVKTRAMFWNKIPDMNAMKTIWKNIDDTKVEIDFEYLMSLFRALGSVVPVSKTRRRRRERRTGDNENNEDYSDEGESPEEKKKEVITLISGDRSKSLSIMLRKMKADPKEIVSRVREIDTTFLEEELAMITMNIPTSEEIGFYRVFKGDRSLLSPADQYFMEISEFPLFKESLELILLHFFGRTEIDKFARTLKDFQTAIKQIKESESFKHILSILLRFGNILNGGGNRGGAYGFKLSTLTKVVNSRSAMPGETLMSYMVSFLEKNNPNCLNLPTELSYIPIAAKVDLKDIRNKILPLKCRLESVLLSAQKGSEKFRHEAEELKKDIGVTIDLTIKLLNKEEEEIKECMKMYYEDQDTCPSDFFNYFVSFLNDFNKTREEIAKKRAEEERQKRLGAMRQQTTNRAGQYNISDQQRGLMDDLMKQIQKRNIKKE